jgi:hypothetical protein
LINKEIYKDNPKKIGFFLLFINIKETEHLPKESEYQPAFIEEIIDEEEFKTHTLNPLDKNEPSILIRLLDSIEPEEV